MAYDYSNLVEQTRLWTNRACASGWINADAATRLSQFDTRTPETLFPRADAGTRPLIVAFMGGTGVGKSSLLNVLCPNIDLKVGSVSDYKSMGRHTTTVSTLHSLSGGGELVDTPGFRDFGLVDSTVEELAEYFPGFEDHHDVACKFRNCRHRTEPGCAVLMLVEQGRIRAERYATYMEILGEVESHQAAARSRDWKNN